MNCLIYGKSCYSPHIHEIIHTGALCNPGNDGPAPTELLEARLDALQKELGRMNHLYSTVQQALENTHLTLEQKQDIEQEGENLIRRRDILRGKIRLFEQLLSLSPQERSERAYKLARDIFFG